MAKVLMIHPDRCTGCRNCELACSIAKQGAFQPTASRVQAYTWEREGMSVPMMCQQCDEAACVKVCPTGAMHRSTERANLVDWNAAVCIRCKMCTMACPFGNARYDAASSSIGCTPSRPICGRCLDAASPVGRMCALRPPLADTRF